jgi:hypothetical protein
MRPARLLCAIEIVLPLVFERKSEAGFSVCDEVFGFSQLGHGGWLPFGPIVFTDEMVEAIRKSGSLSLREIRRMLPPMLPNTILVQDRAILSRN